MADPNEQLIETPTTTTTSDPTSTTTTTTNTSDLTMSDLENNNNNDQIPSTSTLFPDIFPTTTRPDSLPSDIFQATLAVSKTPISSTIVPGQSDKSKIWPPSGPTQTTKSWHSNTNRISNKSTTSTNTGTTANFSPLSYLLS
ncbi:hypothetical protein PPL_04820 [Heterostelium album PN500]|uniref:Uncharacterized protein n=1 Tax=Heterostelium pallidum (strain ATCC 26659 / Pp 5 / PN500) TaxID=670386 RepID=D3B8M7_HETP5|nr:hypothetical protein PPL_04820 [Heterostelium album PN500]EFA82395.1 hypothetical protein PPL_04820 [Heterostelium album PN500]|eukprot:XP_020434512.1 hypothetical protein PPL_04820 [Heterostelium album PN500]